MLVMSYLELRQSWSFAFRSYAQDSLRKASQQKSLWGKDSSPIIRRVPCRREPFDEKIHIDGARFLVASNVSHGPACGIA